MRMDKEEMAKLKNKEEISLIGDYHMEYGLEEHWSDELTTEFNKRWDAIQEKYDDLIKTRSD